MNAPPGSVHERIVNHMAALHAQGVVHPKFYSVTDLASLKYTVAVLVHHSAGMSTTDSGRGEGRTVYTVFSIPHEDASRGILQRFSVIVGCRTDGHGFQPPVYTADAPEQHSITALRDEWQRCVEVEQAYRFDRELEKRRQR